MITPCDQPCTPALRHPHPLYAAGLAPLLSACGAVGELARTSPWGWISAVVAVLAVAGFIAARMRR